VALVDAEGQAQGCSFERAVSSFVSRTAALRMLSPSSRWPLGEASGFRDSRRPSAGTRAMMSLLGWPASRVPAVSAGRSWLADVSGRVARMRTLVALAAP
jgi:hypothetical protein